MNTIQKGDAYIKLVRDLPKKVQAATKHMREEGNFEEDCVGSFWGIVETFPDMKVLMI